MKARHAEVLASQVDPVTPPCSGEDSPRDTRASPRPAMEAPDELAAEGPLTSPLPAGDGFELVDEFDVEEGGGVEEDGVEGEDGVQLVDEGDIKEEEVDEGDIKEEEMDDNEEVDLKEEPEDGEEGAEGEYEGDTEVAEEAEEEGRAEGGSRAGKRRAEEAEGPSNPVRKSSRLRTKGLDKAEPEPGPAKQKMLQKPSERPSQVEEETEEDEEEEEEKEEKDQTEGGEGGEEEDRLGDPTRPPGADSERRLDPDLLQPFRLGWTRECVFREFKNGPMQVEIYYYPPRAAVSTEPGVRRKEAVRRRRSKVDQERYFEEFPHAQLSVCNFSYVRRPLGLNNEAYELIREAKAGLETRATRASDKMREAKRSYREVPEHEGLLSSSGEEDGEGEGGEDGEDEVKEITDFDIGLPLTLQVSARVTPLREEHRRRRRWPDRARCLTPPLAEDMPWTALDDDPLGVYTALYIEQTADRLRCPATPPPLRALRLTQPGTVAEVEARQAAIRAALPDPLERVVAANKELRGAEHLASHDLAIRKFKNYRPPQVLGQARPAPTVRKPLAGFGTRPGPGQGLPGSRPPPAALQGAVKVRLPMPSTNGKRPVVELVMLTNGKYQPIKFTNNRQVTESIPKRLFDQANMMKKTLYQRSMQVPKIGTKQVFLAINPTPGGVRPYNNSPARPAPAPHQTAPPQQQQRPVPQTTDQVSILVRPAAGGNAVLLNVPRSVAAKVKQGTTLSFSASNDQKYTVIDNKMHPPVGRGQKSNSPRPVAKPSPPPQQPGRPAPLPSLPSGVSIRPVPPGAASRKPPRPFGQAARPSPPPRIQSGSTGRVMDFTPCSPFCPGVTGIPELECTQCHSLFHPKCVSIPAWQVAGIQATFRCKRCGTAKGKAEVINLD